MDGPRPFALLGQGFGVSRIALDRCRDGATGGAFYALVAPRHDVSRSGLWSWRKPVRSGALVIKEPLRFLPVQIVAEELSLTVPPSLA